MYVIRKYSAKPQEFAALFSEISKIAIDLRKNK